MKKSSLIYEIIALALAMFVFVSYLIGSKAEVTDANAILDLLKFLKVVKGIGIAGILTGLVAMIKKEGFSFLGLIAVVFCAIPVCLIG